MSLRRTRRVDDHVDWVGQAVFEVGDLSECLEFELEDLSRFPAFQDPLQDGSQGRYRSMQDGRDNWGREDLPFMDAVARFADEIPFHTLLKQINETHRRGLEVEEDDA